MKFGNRSHESVIYQDPASALAVASVLGVGISGYQAYESSQARSKAEKEQERMNKEAQLLNAPKPVTEEAKLSTISSTRKRDTIGLEDLFVQKDAKKVSGLGQSSITKSLGIS
jgi:hypothetical protein